MEDLVRQRSNNTEVIPSKLGELYPILHPQTTAETMRVAEANLGRNPLTENVLDRITGTPGGLTSFQIPGLDGPELVKHITGIVLWWADQRIYFDTPFGEGGPNRSKVPTCKSLDAVWGEGNPGGDCKSCPLAQWESDPKGGRGQACKQIRRLLFLREGQIIPFLVNIPPTSIKPAIQYFLRLTSARLPHWAVVTNLSLEGTQNPDGVKYARMIFSAGPRLKPEERDLIKPFADQMAQMMRTVDITTDDYVVEGEGEQPDTRQE